MLRRALRGRPVHLMVSVVTMPPFSVRASHTPGDVAWLADNYARSASASATINSSSSALVGHAVVQGPGPLPTVNAVSTRNGRPIVGSPPHAGPHAGHAGPTRLTQ